MFARWLILSNVWLQGMAGVDHQSTGRYDQGGATNNPDVQQLARRWRELVDMFTKDAQGVTAALHRRFQKEPGYFEQHGFDAKILNYLAQANDQV